MDTTIKTSINKELYTKVQSTFLLSLSIFFGAMIIAVSNSTNSPDDYNILYCFAMFVGGLLVNLVGQCNLLKFICDKDS